MRRPTCPECGAPTFGWLESLRHRLGAGLWTMAARVSYACTKHRREPAECYTCDLLGQDIRGAHEHSFNELVKADRVESRRRPYRTKIMWEMVARSRAMSDAVKPTHGGSPHA